MTVMRVHIDDTSQEDQLTWLCEDEPFTGEIADYDYDGDGNLIDLMTVVDGVQQGVERSWYGDGALRLEIPIVGGRAVGRSGGRAVGRSARRGAGTRTGIWPKSATSSVAS
jgi:hypothetical protein